MPNPSELARAEDDATGGDWHTYIAKSIWDDFGPELRREIAKLAKVYTDELKR